LGGSAHHSTHPQVKGDPVLGRSTQATTLLLVSTTQRGQGWGRAAATAPRTGPVALALGRVLGPPQGWGRGRAGPYFTQTVVLQVPLWAH
jgi:hypothetical protein